MIIPGILASRVKDQGAGWLLGSTSVLAVSRNTRLEVDGFVKAASVLYVRKLPPERHMARTYVKAASVRYVRKLPRFVSMPLLKSADAMIVTKRDREAPTIVLKTASTLIVTQRPPSAPNPQIRTMSVLVVSQAEVA